MPDDVTQRPVDMFGGVRQAEIGCGQYRLPDLLQTNVAA
jgi:hypothetical protein